MERLDTSGSTSSTLVRQGSIPPPYGQMPAGKGGGGGWGFQLIVAL